MVQNLHEKANSCRRIRHKNTQQHDTTNYTERNATQRTPEVVVLQQTKDDQKKETTTKTEQRPTCASTSISIVFFLGISIEKGTP